MTIQRCSGPGTSTWTSATYTATVNGSSNYVLMWTQTVETQLSTLTDQGSTQKDHVIKWGCDQSATVEITLISGPITSYELLPNFDDVTASIVAGKLQIVVPQGRKFMAIVNDVRSQPIHVISNPLQAAIPSGSVAWATWLAANPGQPLIADGTKIHFPAGEHTVPRFNIPPVDSIAPIVGNNCVFHFDIDAVVECSFYNGLAIGVEFIGNGWMYGSYAVPDDTEALPSTEFPYYSMFTDYDGLVYATDNECNGPTIFAVPAHLTSGGINAFRNVSFLAYYQGGIGDGFSTRPGLDDELTSTIENCYGLAGDDALHAANYNGKLTVSNSTIMTVENACVNLGYWDEPPTPEVGPTFHANAYVHLGIADTDSDDYPRQGLQSVFRGWMDGDEARSLLGWGKLGVRFTGANRIYGPLAGRIFAIGNLAYPFDGGVQDDAAGNQTDWQWESLVVDEVPGQPSLLFGRDADNTPNTFQINDWTVAGVAITSRNWPDYVTQNAFPYDIYINGSPYMVLTVEDGTGLSNSDSYASVSYAATYLSNRGMDTEWAAASTGTKEIALRRATAWLDEVFAERWKGVKMVSTQALEWPRSFAYDQEGVAIEGIVDELKKACVEIAYRVVVDSTVLDSDEAAASNVAASSVTVGPISVSDTFSGAATTAKKFPVVNRLLTLGGLIEAGGWAGR